MIRIKPAITDEEDLRLNLKQIKTELETDKSDQQHERRLNCLSLQALRRVDHNSQRGLITEALINSLSNMKEIAKDVIDAGYIPD